MAPFRRPTPTAGAMANQPPTSSYYERLQSAFQEPSETLPEALPTRSEHVWRTSPGRPGAFYVQPLCVLVKIVTSPSNGNRAG